MNILKHINKKAFVGILVAVVLIVPFSAKAVSMADLQVQIQSLLQMVASLQQQLVQTTGGSTGGTVVTPPSTPSIQPIPPTPTVYPAPPTTPKMWWCDTYADLQLGASGSRVWKLHKVMGVEALGVAPTGYYGNLTRRAWKRFCGNGGSTTVNPADNPQCKAWFDGCNTCSRSYLGGPAMCTMMACIWQNQHQAYCKEYFNDENTNKPPVINSFSGPTTLKAGEKGTWSIKVSDPENGQLSYDIDWGDVYLPVGILSSSAEKKAFIQKTTFTHSYSQSGRYTVQITVRDNAMQTAKTTMTVHVNEVETMCTMEYDPVCGSIDLCNGNLYCMAPSMIKTYSNMCMLKKAGADFVKYGRCEDVDNTTVQQYHNMTAQDSSINTGESTTNTHNCPVGYRWCQAGISGYTCALLQADGSCPFIR